MSCLIHIRSLTLLLALLAAFFQPVSALTPTAPENCVSGIFSIGYDAALAEAPDLGNRTETPTFNYDTASIHRAATETKSTAAERPLFGPNDEFKAAEETGGLTVVGQNRVTFDGMEVRAVRDLSHIDDGTLEAMQEHGFAPTTVNGDPIVLHHLEQNPAGPLVEIPAPNHSIGNVVQHPFGNTPGAGLTAEERAAYNAWRVEYWKARAAAELSSRGQP